jgi:hypothetical protein
MREKLIELIEQEYYCSIEEIADHLIANGVTIPVRCKDCKHWKNEINGCTEEKRFCDIGFYMVHKNGFCSFGERKTNEFER